MLKMYALISDQETACVETAICETCIADSANKKYALEMGSQADDIPDLEKFHDCSENEALYCCICGLGIYGEPQDEDA